MIDYTNAPDYPVLNGGMTHFGWNDTQVQPPSFYYPGYGATAYPPDSRRNMAYNQAPQQAPTPPQFGYGNQPNFNQPVFNNPPQSSNCGLNSIVEDRRFQQPAPMPQQQVAPQSCNPGCPKYSMCYPAQPTQQWTPVPQVNFGRIDERWHNEYVQPQKTNPPEIDWNRQYDNGQPIGGCPYPQVQQHFICPNQQFSQSWTERWNQNKNMR